MGREDEIRERLKAATPGEWSAIPHHSVVGLTMVRATDADVAEIVADDLNGNPEADAALIAHAPADIAYLLAENTALRERAEIAERRNILHPLSTEYIDGLEARVAQLEGALRECQDEALDVMDPLIEEETVCFGQLVHVMRIAAYALLATPGDTDGT